MKAMGSRARDALTRCSMCRADYTGEAYAALAPVATLDAEDVEKHVVVWPAGRVVEIRACARCGHRLARLAESGTRPALRVADAAR